VQSVAIAIILTTEGSKPVILDRNAFGIWSSISKRAFKATFRRPDSSFTEDTIRDSLKEKNIGIYIHVPFCKSICPACPYVRSLWNKELADKYVQALEKEIRIYGEILGDLKLRVIDMHAGGGSPSLLGADSYAQILDCLGRYFSIDEANFGIEANPEDISKEKASELAGVGIKEISLGIQSFYENNLKVLGRRYDVGESFEAIRNARRSFDFVNIDMMYMLPGQKAEEWVKDLIMATEQDVDEITTYPLLLPDYVPMNKVLRKGTIVEQPSKNEFKRMFRSTFDILESRGYKSVELYGFSRVKEKYATVNLEMEGPLLGLGCSSSGFMGSYEYQNTCSVKEYLRCLFEGKLPIAGIRNIDTKEHAIRWTVCRLFVCKGFEFKEFEQKFRTEFNEIIGRDGFGTVLKFLKFLGIIHSNENGIRLNERGLFIANSIVWSFVLNIPCRMVEEFIKTPWPLEVTIP